MSNQKFICQIEDFTCLHCGRVITGNGYTNHCPHCLWSQHVDNNPGDRASTCHGLMLPISLTKKGEEYIITHQCLKCQHTKPNKMSSADDFDLALKIGH